VTPIDNCWRKEVTRDSRGRQSVKIIIEKKYDIIAVTVLYTRARAHNYYI